MDFISALDESHRRNAYLVTKNGGIPSYALWRETDIENQTIDERISWWEESEKTPGQQSILQNLLYMKKNGITSESLVDNNQKPNFGENVNSDNHYKEKKVKSDTTESNKINNNIEEFCSKRYSNELYCDI
jgi:hypothetical protein